MANGTRRRRKNGQNGVQAIFTTEKRWKSRTQALVGLLAIAAGAALWILAIGLFRGSAGMVASWTTVSSSIVLVSVAIPLVMGGVGLCTYYLATRRTRKEHYRIESAITELEALVRQKSVAPNPPLEASPVANAFEAKFSRFRVSKTLAVALVEGAMLVIAYSGLVQEYRSNANMQEWVRANIALGAYFLNYNVVLLFTGTLLGAVAFLLRPKKRPK